MYDVIYVGGHGKIIAPAIHDSIDRVIHRGACLLMSVTVTGKGGAGYITVYDGVNDTGNVKYIINCVDDNTVHVDLATPTDFDTGIYIAIESQTSIVYTVQYKPLVGGNEYR